MASEECRKEVARPKGIKVTLFGRQNFISYVHLTWKWIHQLSTFVWGFLAPETGETHAFFSHKKFRNIALVSRCCWQYRALSVSRSYNSGKDFWKHGFRASNWQISLRDLRGPFLRTSGFDPRKRTSFTYGRKAKTDRYCLVWQIFVKITAIRWH